MQDVLVSADRRNRNLSLDEVWQQKVQLVLSRLS